MSPSKSRKKTPKTAERKYPGKVRQASEMLDAPPAKLPLAQTENYVEYSRY